MSALRLLLPFAAGYFLSFLLRNLNAVISPELTHEVGLSSSDLGLLTSAYFFTFALFQLPLGVLLDRYGPQRVESVLLLIAALGCVWFSFAAHLPELIIARALIGLGVSACLMASFKVLALWYPKEKLASLNATIMVAGGLGALAATTPLVWFANALGWRGMFLALAAITSIVAIAIFLTPKRSAEVADDSLSGQLKALNQILKSRVFWTYAPMTATSLGAFVALQGLWAVPWLMTTNGMTREMAAFHMLLTTVAMICGWLATATLLGPLRRLSITPGAFMTICNLGGLILMLMIWLDWGDSRILWFVRGVFYAVGNIAFAELTSRFPSALAGRVNTALNFVTFVGAFAVQIGYGVSLQFLSLVGMSLSGAHYVTFGILIALQFLGLLWYLIQIKKLPRPV